VSFRKKDKKATEEDEDMKVVHAEDSQKQYEKSDQVQSQRRTDQTTGQQSGQESGEPTNMGSESEEELKREDSGDGDSEDDSDDSEPVPDGTTAEILKWVGDDKKRAQAALDKEQAEEKPRTGLTGELKQILE
jgi:hypothetical protein